MAAFIQLQQAPLEFRSNASISAHPGQKKESVWTQKASACHIIYCAGRQSERSFETMSLRTQSLRWVCRFIQEIARELS